MHVVLFVRCKLKFSSFHDSCGVIAKKNFEILKILSENAKRNKLFRTTYLHSHQLLLENFCYMRLGHHLISTMSSYMSPSQHPDENHVHRHHFQQLCHHEKMHLALVVGHLPGCQMTGTSLSVPTSKSAICSAVKRPRGILQKVTLSLRSCHFLKLRIKKSASESHRCCVTCALFPTIFLTH